MKINDATLPLEISTNLAAASAVPPVGSNHQLLEFSRFTDRIFMNLYRRVPISNSKSTEYLSAGNIFSEHYKGFFNI